MAGLAARRRAGIQHPQGVRRQTLALRAVLAQYLFTWLRIEQARCPLRAGVLHRHVAFVEAGQAVHRHRAVEGDGVRAGLMRGQSSLVEALQIARHIARLRDIQQRTGGFTEFVPLSFVNTEAPMFMKGLVENVRPGPTGMDVIKVHAIARIMLNNWIPNIQASWVKEGNRMSQLLLTAGVNDLGGTLINESISTAAGAQHGQLMRPSEFRQMIRQAGRIPAERYTTYQIKRVFDNTDEELDPLDLVGDNVEDIFGSYQRLVKLDAFRFEHPRRSTKPGVEAHS